MRDARIEDIDRYLGCEGCVSIVESIVGFEEALVFVAKNSFRQCWQS